MRCLRHIRTKNVRQISRCRIKIPLQPNLFLIPGRSEARHGGKLSHFVEQCLQRVAPLRVSMAHCTIYSDEEAPLGKAASALQHPLVLRSDISRANLRSGVVHGFEGEGQALASEIFF